MRNWREGRGYGAVLIHQHGRAGRGRFAYAFSAPGPEAVSLFGGCGNRLLRTMFESTRPGDGSTGSTIDFQSIRWLCDGGSRLSGPTRSACELLRKLGDNGGMSRILSQIDGLVRIRLVVVQFNHFGGVEKLLIAVGVVALGILIGGLGSPPFGIAVSTRPDGITDSIARIFNGHGVTR